KWQHAFALLLRRRQRFKCCQEVRFEITSEIVGPLSKIVPDGHHILKLSQVTDKLSNFIEKTGILMRYLSKSIKELMSSLVKLFLRRFARGGESNTSHDVARF